MMKRKYKIGLLILSSAMLLTACKGERMIPFGIMKVLLKKKTNCRSMPLRLKDMWKSKREK